MEVGGSAKVKDVENVLPLVQSSPLGGGYLGLDGGG
jgi:hypothetical protein